VSYCYCNNGAAMRLVEDGYEAQSGEAVFASSPSEEDLCAVFPGRTAALLADAKSEQIAALSAACQASILAGFKSSALGSLHIYPAKTTDQLNLSASVLASLMPGLPPNWETPFWCADEVGDWAFAPHTAAQIQQVGQDGKAAIIAAIMRNQQLASKVAAATTVEAVQGVKW